MKTSMKDSLAKYNFHCSENWIHRSLVTKYVTDQYHELCLCIFLNACDYLDGQQEKGGDGEFEGTEAMLVGGVESWKAQCLYIFY